MENNKINIEILERPFSIPKNYFESLYSKIQFKLKNGINQVEAIQRNGFAVPVRYFDTFDQRILDRLKDEQFTINEKNGFKIPAHYFVGLEDSIFNKLDELKLESLLGAKKESFKVPQNYFEKLSEKNIISVPKLKSKGKVQFINYRKWIYAAAAMTIIAVSSFVFYFNHQAKTTVDPFVGLSNDDLMEYAYENANTFDPIALQEVLTDTDLSDFQLNDINDSKTANELIEYLQ